MTSFIELENLNRNIIDINDKFAKFCNPLTQRQYMIIAKNKFFPSLDISFMNYFLRLQSQSYGYIVHHSKLIEYGAISQSDSTSNVKRCLNSKDLKEDIDYQCIKTDIQRPDGSTIKSNQYYLTPNSFKFCLLRATKHVKRDIDPKIYGQYYMFLETILYFYVDYQLKFRMNKYKTTIDAKDRQIEALKKQLEKKQ